ncbi:HAMP domain-containing sensor histidine kinase [uncultured Desulfuromonas sp.]|uniref:sensor histidine kinase n=1 Tax=uncultured Desulfuromonas sp. TaxID=181013 RepID=UPI002AAA81FB|nr:HAMP domain-containing sensor histidine kinase [uncultured Desulfuromonas sp.]
MKLQRPSINPLLAFIAIQFTWIVVVVFWIYWFLGSHRRLRSIAEKYSPELLQPGIDWVILTEGLLLLFVILAGVYVIFLYWRRQLALNREQKSFVSQVTHELKSPVASVQLHLETIRRHHPAEEQLDEFIDTMLADTERLNSLINKMITANRLEQSRWRLTLRQCNLSEFLDDYMRQWRNTQDDSLQLNCEIAPDIHANIEPDSFSMVLRNLLENAVLYSDPPAKISVELKASHQRCHLLVRDQGRGIAASEQHKVFRLFYRLHREDSHVKGSGLGLFIVRALVKRHKGQIMLHSHGPGKGTTFHIILPQRVTEKDA